jgi:quercetin dioxygenase-like cupin family protein
MSSQVTHHLIGVQAQRKVGMNPYSIINLFDVEDSVSARAPGLEGRFARTQLDSRDLGISHFRYAPGLQGPFGHRHGEQEEAYIVAAGSGKVLLDGEVHELKQWDVVRVAPPVVRAFSAGPQGMDVIAIGGPKPEAADGEMMEVVWPD